MIDWQPQFEYYFMLIIDLHQDTISSVDQLLYSYDSLGGCSCQLNLEKTTQKF